MKTTIKLLILIMLISLSTSTLTSKSKRSSKSRVETKKAEALKTLQENSSELSILAGVDPLSNDSLQIIQTEDESVGDEGEDLEELAVENDVVVDIDKLNMLWIAYLSEDEEEEYSDNGIKKDEFMEYIVDWLGTPYRFGGTTKRGVDCSAFMRHIYKNSLNIQMPRTANEQYGIGMEIERDNLQFGDLVFFKTRRYAPITHVGVYLGDDLFAHASSRNGVTIASLNSSYYARTYKGAKRITTKEILALEIPNTDNASVGNSTDEFGSR